MTAGTRQAYLDAMGIQTWVQREEAGVAGAAPVESVTAPAVAATPPADTPVVPPAPAKGPAPELGRLGWDELAARVRNCTACELHTTRTQTVFGVGDHHADWMIIGEAPGAEEDRQGEPFVGRAGQLLTNMLRAIGLQREMVYIANILKCRPPNNRDPRPEEIAQCEGYLRRQVELVAPKVILAVGRIAAHNLLKTGEPLGRLRGKVHHYGDTPLVVTYHPAYLLRTPRDKAKAWVDLRFAREVSEGRRT
jgi:uracil-DNA glycosylase family 4